MKTPLIDQFSKRGYCIFETILLLIKNQENTVIKSNKFYKIVAKFIQMLYRIN